MAEQSNVVFPRKLLRRFLALYKDQPCLWDRSCAAYKQKQKRLEAISKLTELVQEYDPGATRVHILRKIESLRACVRREYKRVQDSRQKATSPEDIYVPHLWYYDMLSFVFGEEGSNYKMKGPSGSSLNAGNSDEDEDSAQEDNSYEPTVENYPSEYNVATSLIEVTESSPMAKRFTSFDDEYNKKRHCTEIEDEYDAIGINVAAKLRSLPSSMRILAEKLINDVLFQAQTNGLTTSTVITTPDPFK